MSDFPEEDFEIIEVHVECGSENQSQSQTLLDFVDVLPDKKLSPTHKATLKQFLLESEVTIEDFTTNLTESSIQKIIHEAPIPLGPRFRFLRAVLDLRRSHTSRNVADPKHQWSCLEIVSWMKREFPALAIERMRCLEESIHEHNITGRCLFDPEERNAFKTNQAIPLNVRSQLLELVENYDRALRNATECKENSSPVVLHGNHPMYERRWYWYNDKHGFILFDPVASAQITEAIRAGEGRVVLSQGQFFAMKSLGTYELIIDQTRPNGPHTQRNTRTSESRAVISELHEFISSGRNDALVKNNPRTF